MYLKIPELIPIRINGPKTLFGLRMKYSPHFTAYYAHLDSLLPSSALYLPTLDKYQQLPKDTLRWKVTAHAAAKTLKLAVAREKLRRRVRAAFRVGLENEGYAWDGKRVGEPAKADLLGTWEIICQTGEASDADPQELLDVAQTCIRIIEGKGPATRSARQRKKARGPAWWEIDLARVVENDRRSRPVSIPARH